MSVAAYPDPTLTSLEKLDDPTRFHVVRNVPVFIPHKRWQNKQDPGWKTTGHEPPGPRDDWQLLYEVRTGDLPDIVRACQDLERYKGVVGTLTYGHRRPGQPQEIQPAIGGFYRVTDVGRFGPHEQPAVLCDFYYHKDRWPEAREYPFRSVEFRPTKKTITSIALLKTDPELDMGTLIFESPDTVHFYSRGEEHYMAEEKKEKEKEEGHPPEKKPDGGEKVADGNCVTPGGGDMEGYAKVEPHMHAFMGKHYPHMQRMHAEAAQRYGAEGGMGAPPAAGPGMPGATNTAIPGLQPPPNTAAEQTLPMERNAKEQLALYERDNRELKDRLAALEARTAKKEREAELAQYSAEITELAQQYAFDVAKAKDRVKDFTRPQFDAWKLDAIENYSRRPAAGGLIPSGGDPLPEKHRGKKRLTREGAQAATRRAERLMKENPKLDAAEAYEAAAAEILADPVS